MIELIKRFLFWVYLCLLVIPTTKTYGDENQIEKFQLIKMNEQKDMN